MHRNIFIDVRTELGIEIERKFLVRDDRWRERIEREYEMIQGYLSTDVDRTIRVRIRDQEAFLTIKGKARGLVRREFEYPVPLEDAQIMLREFCGDTTLYKRRFEVREGGHIWEVDVFEEKNAGLVVAEVELSRPDEEFVEPSWLGEEVTGQSRYYNARLVEEPYGSWNLRGGGK